MLEIIEKVLKSGISWRDINIFYGNFKNYPKWNTVFKFYKKLIERKIISLQDVQGNVKKIFCKR